MVTCGVAGPSPGAPGRAFTSVRKTNSREPLVAILAIIIVDLILIMGIILMVIIIMVVVIIALTVYNHLNG